MRNLTPLVARTFTVARQGVLPCVCRAGSPCLFHAEMEAITDGVIAGRAWARLDPAMLETAAWWARR